MTCGCGTELSPALLVCPSCQRLVHADRLKALAADAAVAAGRDDRVEELAAWRRVLELLPPASNQAAQVRARVTALSDSLAGIGAGGDAAAGGGAGAGGSGSGSDLATGQPNRKRWGARGALAASLTFLATKIKFLLLGLTKAGTLLTMLLSVGVYWTLFGWPFAVLLVLSIYVHEMGHVAALRRFGLPASAPMFIPGLGALIRLRQHPDTAREDARIGLAGPLWGLGAAVVAYLCYRLTGAALWAAVARFGAWINLFNLLPFWQLDGGRAFRALARWQRLAVMAVLVILWAVTREGLLVLLLLAAGIQAFRDDAPAEPDPIALAQYTFLAAALTLLSQLAVPAGALPAR
jgi:Zn-dependent protease